MRKIVTKGELDKKRKRNQLIIGLILVGVMFFSVVGYSFSGKEAEEEKKVIYNGFEFKNSQGFWIVEVEGRQFAFMYNPNKVEKINSELNHIEGYYGKPLYIYSEDQEAEFEIYRNLDRLVLRRQYACLENQNCSNNEWPIKNCTDNFIIIKEAPISNLVQEENCVFISGPRENLSMVTDEFLLRITGIN